jgi:hypothetical protein
LPGVDLTFKQVPILNPTVQALAAENADFDLDHVEPAGMLGRVMEHRSAKQFRDRAFAQDVLESFPKVGVQVAQHQTDTTLVSVGTTVSTSPMKATKSTLVRRSVTETMHCPALGSIATNRSVVG